jgi:glycosyltransferase involved in cell wall biosynthesis
MRVLWLNHRDSENPRWGGAEKTILEVGSRLVARGHEVDWFSSRWRGAPAHSTVRGIRISRFGGTLGPHIAAAAVLRGHSPPDVVVDDLAHALPWASNWLSSVPTVVFFHHLHARTLSGQVAWPISTILKLGERNYARIYASTIFVTESTQSMEDLQRLGIPRGRCVKIPPGVDTKLFHPGIRSQPPSILYFGGLRHYKRPEDAIRAFAQFRRLGSEGVLTIVGGGPCLPHVAAVAHEQGVEAQVRILGRLSTAELASVLESSTVNVHCAVAEGWCFSAMEAAACGVPTVAYDAPGIRESIVNGVSGLLVESGSTSALAEGIARVVCDPERWREPTLAHARSFRWDATAEAWERVLTQCSSG